LHKVVKNFLVCSKIGQNAKAMKDIF